MYQAAPTSCAAMPALSDLIGSYYIRGYLQGALQKGFDPREILVRAGIPPTVYDDPNAAINGEQLQNLILKVREAMNDHYMGFLQVPGKLAMDMEAGRAAVKGDTLGEGVRNLAAFINAVRSDEERGCMSDEEKGEFAVTYHFTDFNPGVDPHLLYWFRMYWGYRFYCWLVGQPIKLTQVCFSLPKPVQGINYTAVFHCPVVFEQPVDKFCFDKKYLLEPAIRNEVELFSGDFPLKYPNWFTLPGKDQSLASQVEQIIIELNKQGMPSPSVDVVSGIMSVSSRTLSRKLAREQASFQKIKTKVRCEIAKKLLVGSDIPVTQIADKVGFAEPGDFTRAFTGWTGQTPSSYRAVKGK